MSRIKEIRERLRLTQSELAEGIGCSQGNVGFIERGEQRLKPEKAELLIDLAAKQGLKLTLDQVYGRMPLPADRRHVKAN